jgi:hypothetical protein
MCETSENLLSEISAVKITDTPIRLGFPLDVELLCLEGQGIQKLLNVEH